MENKLILQRAGIILRLWKSLRSLKNSWCEWLWEGEALERCTEFRRCDDAVGFIRPWGSSPREGPGSNNTTYQNMDPWQVRHHPSPPTNYLLNKWHPHLVQLHNSKVAYSFHIFTDNQTHLNMYARHSRCTWQTYDWVCMLYITCILTQYINTVRHNMHFL